jgi:transcription elongation factor Elf1
MDITFNCPKCRQKLVVRENDSRQKVQCPRCQESVTTPRPAVQNPASSPHAALNITFNCSHCGIQLTVDAREAGQRKACPSCEQFQTVPSQRPVSPPQPPAATPPAVKAVIPIPVPAPQPQLAQSAIQPKPALAIPVSIPLVSGDKTQRTPHQNVLASLKKVKRWVWLTTGFVAVSVVAVALLLSSTSADTRLHGAASAGDLPGVRLLLSSGSNVNGRDEEGKTPLHRAVFDRIWLPGVMAERNVAMLMGADGHLAVAKLLIQHGANVNATDKNGETPLHSAAFTNFDGHAIRLLIASGANVNAKDHFGRTPLFVAASCTNTEVVEQLLDSGADISIKDKNGKTVLHVAAAETVSTEILQLLIRKGADVNAKDAGGSTPLDYAMSKGRWENAQTLVNHGAKRPRN